MLSLFQAQSLILANVSPAKTELVSLEDSIGRILAAPVISDREYPPFNRAAMDGFALQSSSFEKGKTFTVVKEIYAGQLTEISLNDTECVRIMTGAPVPSSCDVVIRMEDAVVNEQSVSFILNAVKPWQHIARKGEDLKQGQTALHPGIVIRSGEAAIAASLGYAALSVASLPRVALITTGNEIIPVDQQPLIQQIRNSNAWTVTALLRNFLISPSRRIHIDDDPALLEEEFRNAKNGNEVLIVSGGVSAGKADHVPDALTKAGYNQVFHKVAIKPGKPIWFGIAENGHVVFALPGNPLSVQVCFKLFVELWLRQHLGTTTSVSHKVMVAETHLKKNNLDEFLMAVYNKEQPGVVHFKPFNGSGDITSTSGVDGFVLHAADTGDMKVGDVVNFFPL